MKKIAPEFWLQLLIIVGGCFCTAIGLTWQVSSRFTTIDSTLVMIRTTQLSVLSEQEEMKEDIREIREVISPKRLVQKKEETWMQ